MLRLRPAGEEQRKDQPENAECVFGSNCDDSWRHQQHNGFGRNSPLRRSQRRSQSERNPRPYAYQVSLISISEIILPGQRHDARVTAHVKCIVDSVTPSVFGRRNPSDTPYFRFFWPIIYSIIRRFESLPAFAPMWLAAVCPPKTESFLC